MSTPDILLGSFVRLLFIAGISLLVAAVRQHQSAGNEWDRHR
jgi:hypothetical protein